MKSTRQSWSAHPLCDRCFVVAASWLVFCWYAINDPNQGRLGGLRAFGVHSAGWLKSSEHLGWWHRRLSTVEVLVPGSGQEGTSAVSEDMCKVVVDGTLHATRAILVPNMTSDEGQADDYLVSGSFEAQANAGSAARYY